MYNYNLEAFARAMETVKNYVKEKDKYFLEENMEIRAYTETHSDTSLGRGGMAGQAITTALTTAIFYIDKIFIFRSSRLDYILDLSNRQEINDTETHANIFQDFYDCNMAIRTKAREKYKKFVILK